MRKTIIGTVVLASAFVLGQTAYADSDNMMAKPALGHGEVAKHVASSLHLDAAQKEKIKTIKDEFKASQKENWAQLKIIRAQLREQVQSDKMDEGKVDKLIDERMSLMRKMLKAAVMSKHQIYNVLTPEQKTAWQAMHKKAEEKLMKHAHHHE